MNSTVRRSSSSFARRLSQRAMVMCLVSCCGLAAAWSTLPSMPDANTSSSESTASSQPSEPGARAARAGEFVVESLPIKRITLYRSGVGSFERRGLVDGDARVQLRFNTDQVNDILKSMVVLDMGGGQVDGISYGSKEPLSKRLASFGVDVSTNPSVHAILGQLRGSKASVTTPEGKISGTILGIENRPEAIGQVDKPVDTPYLNLLTSGGIRSLNFRLITSVVLDDADLNNELNKALSALAEYRADRTKTVDVRFRGEGSRDVVVAYVNEMPVWKTSYRLVLPDGVRGKDSAGLKDQGMPTIQGWAIVENTTDEDWNNVTLSLVSGRPVSFVMDLYEPLYVERPEIPVPTIPGVSPRIYQESSAVANQLASLAEAESGEYKNRRESMSRSAQRGPGAPAPASAGRAMDKSSPFRDAQREDAGEAMLDSAALTNYAARAQAQAIEAGELFQYQIDHPVTVERQRSAMLPILSSAIEGRRVSIYNRGDGSSYAMRGIELKNTSNLQLLPGPISVYDAGNYAGDAQIGHVPPGDKRLLAYSVDLDLPTVAKDEATSVIQKIRIVKGAIEQTVKQVSSTTYAFKNKDEKRERVIIVEHPRWDGWELVQGGQIPKPVENTAGSYRFEVTAEPGKNATLTVSQEQTQYSSVGVFDMDFNWLSQQQQGGKMSKAALDAVREAGRRQGLVEDARRAIAALEKEKSEIDADQARLRQNISSIDRTSQLYSRYMTKLSDQETRLDKLITELEGARENERKLQADLEAYISSLSVD
jgi:hypothetical protein